MSCTCIIATGGQSLNDSPIRIFRACLAGGYILIAWRQVKVTFIPKPRKANYIHAKTYRPISLSSFMLKTVEKLVDRQIRDQILGLLPLHRYQFAYQQGKSIETTLHYVIARIEDAVESRQVTLGAFLDSGGVFASTSHSIIIDAAKRHGLEDTICRCRISFMLGHSHTCKRDSGGVCGQGLSAGRCFVTPAVESGCG
jgi:hypothetical protein